MKLNNISNNIYVLNLKKRTDRKNHILSELTKIECTEFTLFEAVDGNDLVNNTKLKSGMFGLINTYLKIYDDWKLKGSENILIIEDDCVFVDDFNQKLQLYMDNIPNDWEMLYFGANHNYHVGHKTEKINDYCIKLNNSYSAHCVVLKSHVFEELINNIKNFTVENDVMMAKLQTKYNAYSSIPNLTSQLPNFSDIENGVRDYNWLIK